jgi:PKD repeat protein
VTAPSATPRVSIGAVEATLAAGEGPAAGSSFQCATTGPAAATCGAANVPQPRTASTWNNESPYLSAGVAPPAGSGASLAYDATDGYYVLYGGCFVTECPSNETWWYLNGTWENETAFVGSTPPAVDDAQMDYDANFGAIVLFGGCSYTGGCPENQTWEYSGGTWTNLTSLACPSICPTPVYAGSMAYDPADGFSVLFGGCTVILCLGTSNQTWVFDAAAGGWYNLGGTQPFGRAYAGMAYDPLRAAMVLFGGQNNCGFTSPPCDQLSDTWVYNFTYGWSYFGSFDGINPPGLSGFGLTWNSADQSVFLEGGYNQTTGVSSSTWEYQCTEFCSWANVTPSVPGPARAFMTMASNVSGQAPWFIGGANLSEYTVGDQWAWGVPPSIASVSLAPNPTEADGYWWTNVTMGLGAAPYSANYGFPSFGNQTFDDYLTSVQFFIGVYDATIPEQITVVDALGLMTGETVTEDMNPHAAPVITPPSAADVGGAATFAGSVSPHTGVGPFTYFWNFSDGSNATGATVAHTFAATGTYNVSLTVTDHFGLVNSTYVHVTVSTHPGVAATGSPSSIDPGMTVKFSATGSGGSPPYNYTWNFGDATTGFGATPSHTYATGGSTYHAVVTLRDLAGLRVNSTVNITVNAPLTLSATSNLSAVTTGSTISFSATVSGGSGGYTYSWNFGDGTTGTGATTTHAFATAGTFTVQVTATDSLGQSSSKSLSITVSKASSGGGGSSGGFSLTSPLGIALIVVVVLVIVGLAVALGLRGRGSRGTAPPQAWSPPPTAGGPVPPPPGGSPPPPPPGA